MATSSVTPPTITLGIDVSHFQGEVDWATVAGAGVAFAFTKATDGVAGVDAKFSENWSGISAAGLVRGAYHFFRPALDASAQASHFCETVGALNPGDLPPVLDIEEAMSQGVDTWDAVPADQRVPLILTWLQAVEARLGRRPIVYTAPGFAGSKLPNAAQLGLYPLWVAHYTMHTSPTVPSAWSSWAFWQYSGTGSMDGVTGQVDLDRFQGTTDDLASFSSPAAASA